MRTHRFTVGQMVRLTNSAGLTPKAASVYTIEAPLPPRDNSPQYRLWNEQLGQGRVAMECDLETIILT